MRDFNPGRSGRTTHETMVHAPNAALLIDFDNVTMGIRSDLQNQLRRLMNSEMIKGKVAVQRAYADWRRYPQYIVPLSEASIDLIFAPAFGSNKKNATDIRLAIDALELVFTRPEIGTYILLSGDSDFSSLVLKLKEYGKYVIGVGIRESSSDLLIQNCDEYYSYNELTGFTKEHETELVTKDPWELVVEAVVQMRQNEDVMRSDRLKQVMQSIDPTFNEKDAGFSRFSKFMTEAQKRGLVSLIKLENGQSAVDLGRHANVSPEEEQELKEQVRAEAKEPRGRSRRGRRGGAKSRPAGGLTLAEAFELMRQSLLVLGAVGDESVTGDGARAKMMELFGADGDPLFDRPRFQRLLRQAHDADLIELVKQDDDYVMKLNPGAVTEAPDLATVEPAAEAAPAAERKDTRGVETDDVAAGQPSPRAAGARRSRGPRSRGGDAARKDASADQPRAGNGSAGATVTAARDERAGGGRQRSPRHRRGPKGGEGSPGAGGPGVRGGGERSMEPSAKQTVEPPPKPSPSGARAVGPRRGGRARPVRPAIASDVGKVAPGTMAQARQPQEPRSPEPPRAPLPRAPEPRVEPPPVSAPPSTPADTGGDDAGGGLLKRMGAAFQKAMRGMEDSGKD